MSLKNTFIFILIAVICAAVLQLEALDKKNKKLIAENERLADNQLVLLTEADSYRVADSLNATQVVALTLELDEYKKYRAEDAKLISQLKSKAIDKVISTNLQSNNYVNASVKTDTLYVDDSSVRCFEYKSEWLDIEGCLAKDTAELQVESRDALKIIESVEYKRFLGFLWRTNKVKRRQVDVVSKNPATTITDVEYISVEH